MNQPTHQFKLPLNDDDCPGDANLLTICHQPGTRQLSDQEHQLLLNGRTEPVTDVAFFNNRCPICCENGAFCRRWVARIKTYEYRAGCANLRCPNWVGTSPWTPSAQAAKAAWMMTRALLKPQ